MGCYASIRKSSFFVSTENTGRVLAKFQKKPYKFELDDIGNIVGISMDYCPFNFDLPVFKSIATYVKDGSFILMDGEEDESWKWVFQNGTCKEVTPKISWEDT